MTKPAKELRVSTNTSCNRLAGYVILEHNDGYDLTLVASGPAAVSQGLKAVFIANKHLEVLGVRLLVDPRMERREFVPDTGPSHPWVVTLLRLVEEDLRNGGRSGEPERPAE